MAPIEPPSTDVEPDGLPTPAARFGAIGTDIGTVKSEVLAQLSAANTASGHPDVASACSIFSSGVGGALDACGSDTGLLGMAVRASGIVYESTDKVVGDALLSALDPLPASTPTASTAGAGHER